MPFEWWTLSVYKLALGGRTNHIEKIERFETEPETMATSYKTTAPRPQDGTALYDRPVKLYGG
jgi:hypothetical protein